MTTLLIEGKKVKVSDDFLSMTPEQQEATVEEIARSLNLEPRGGFMANVNQGIAEGTGGLIDFFNPFDKPHALNPFENGVSAQRGIEAGMDAIGVNRAEGEPQNAFESFARGTGQAAGVAPIAGAGARALSGAPGLIGQFFDDAATSLNTVKGTSAELLAGGGGQLAQDEAERAGYPDWVQSTLGVAGGVAAGALPYAASNAPGVYLTRKLAQNAKAAAMPYTEAGAKEVARQRMQELAGGEDRAEELARMVQNGSELNLTPAQQTGDPNLLGLEQEAMRRNPLIRETVDARARASEETANEALRGMGGDPVDAQRFFEQRRAAARENILGVVDRMTNGALRPTAQNSEMLNSDEVANAIEAAAQASKQQENRLWQAIDRNVPVSTQNTRQVAQSLIEETPRAQQDDIARVVQDLLGRDSNNPFGETETVNEMHGLYSKLREIARGAKAGPAPRNNMARISNAIADAILEDLGATAESAPTAVGRQINEARAFTAEREQIFNQGTVGRLRRQTISGDDAIAPELALERSIGRGGSTAAVSADDILRATDGAAEPNLEDFLRSRFDRTAFTADGGYNERGALTFMRDNADVMQRFPYLRETFDEAIQTQSRASRASSRADRALTDMDNPTKSVGAAFTQAAPENAIDAVFKAKRPSVAARSLAATARKDSSGQAMDGLKGSFADYIIKRSTDANGLSGDTMQKLLGSNETRTALTAVLEPAEIRRMDIIAAELKKLRDGRKAAPDIGGLSPRSPNRILEIVGKIIAARQGAQYGGGGGASIQTANIASSSFSQKLGSLQNDKAEQLLMDAITDPDLFRLLLTEPGKTKYTPKQVQRLTPYFTGAGAATITEEN